MKVSLNWIKDFVDLEGIEISEISHRFTMSTAEIEEVVEMGGDISNVIVAKIVGVEPHPRSDKLKICRVDTGGVKVRSLCGAPNAREGIKVPFAMEGGAIKGMKKVERVEMGGIESCGIICSPREIGISDSHEGVMELRDDYEIGKDIRDYMDIDDIIIEIDNKSLTNRPDLWGHYGIAREMAAIFGRKLKPIALDELNSSEGLPELDIVIEDMDKCNRYCGLGIADIKGGITPVNMQIRLYYCGMRPIEPIVDLTNYIMLEMGQPMHAFDRRQIQKLVVRSTDGPMPFTTLDGVKRKIPEDVLMINNSDKPVAIAGIMGGENSEISGDTEELFLESANFGGYTTRKSSIAIGLRTEASARFEKMLDPSLPELSIKRFVHLLKGIKPDMRLTSKLTDVYPGKPEPVSITIDKPYIDRYVGESIEPDRIVKILESLEFDVQRKGNSFKVGVPSFRATKDVTIKADLVEEITRIYGYDNIRAGTVQVVLEPLDYNEERLTEHKVKELLAENFGFNEVHSYVWYDSVFNKRTGIEEKGTLRIVNPHAEDCSMLRESMAPSMLQAAEGNLRYMEDFSIFEIGSIFIEDGEKKECCEEKNLCILMADRNKKEDELFYTLKGIATNLGITIKKTEFEYGTTEFFKFSWTHPVKSAEIYAGGNRIGYVSVVHPSVAGKMDSKAKMAVLELSMTRFNKVTEHNISYREPSRYQETSLDFSFLVDSGIPFSKVKEDINGFRDSLLNKHSFIDIYEGRGLPDSKKSMTFRFVIGSRERTLSSSEIDDFSERLLGFMKERGYTLR